MRGSPGSCNMGRNWNSDLAGRPYSGRMAMATRKGALTMRPLLTLDREHRTVFHGDGCVPPRVLACSPPGAIRELGFSENVWVIGYQPSICDEQGKSLSEISLPTLCSATSAPCSGKISGRAPCFRVAAPAGPGSQRAMRCRFLTSTTHISYCRNRAGKIAQQAEIGKMESCGKSLASPKR